MTSCIGMKTNAAGKGIIKFYESLHDGDLSMIGLQPKMCPAGVWTEGYGHAMVYQGKLLKGEKNKALAYKLQIIHDEAEAERQLAIDLISREKFVTNASIMINGGLNENQFSALVSFVYNLGEEKLQNSTLYKYLCAGRFQDAANEFVKWNKCNSKALDGLTYRRLSEKALFLSLPVKLGKAVLA